MKLGNRRKKRPQYLLEVKAQTQGRARRRVRAGLLALAGVGLLVGTGYGLLRLGRFAADRLVYENPRFAIAQITLENDGVLTHQRALQFAGVQLGQNLIALDLSQVRRNLEMIPLVRCVEVHRVIPNRLVIRIQERVPVARLSVPGREWNQTVFWVDRSGVVMTPLRLPDGTVVAPQIPRPVPILTGVTLADLRVGRPVQSEQIYRALDLLDQLGQAVAGSWVDVERIDLSNRHQLVLTTRQRAVVRFDTADFSRQLRRLGVIMAWAQTRQRLVQQVDLTVGRGVPVVMN